MEGVLSGTRRGRARVTAVGAVLGLCLVGAPVMSLFPVALWDVARALTLSGAALGVLLLAPVAVGALLLMFLLTTGWLKAAGVRHPASSAALVTGTSMATPVVMAFLAPALTPFPGGTIPNIAVVSALVATAAMATGALTGRAGKRWRLGVLPGLAVAAAALLLLPLASEHMRDRFADQRSLSQVNGFEHTIAILDYPGWVPSQVHEVRGGLRVTYTSDGGAGTGGDPPDAGSGPDTAPDGSRVSSSGTVYVLSWNQEQTDEGIYSGCDFTGVECVDSGGLVVVHRDDEVPGDGRPGEVRTRLDDGAIASVLRTGASPVDELTTMAQSLRAEEPGERVRLAEEVTRG